MSTRYHYFNGYQLRMSEVGTRDRNGHEMIAYRLQSPERITIFEGSDFGASPMHDSLGKDSAIALMNFLTLKPGDTDSEYFANYTDVQMAFAQSAACENLGSIVYVYENRR